jgi:hypothetical protein
MNKFEKAKFVISLILKRLPLIYLKNIYDNMNLKKITKFSGKDDELIKYIDELFFSNTKLKVNKNSNNKVNIKDLESFKIMLSENMDNICYKSNIGSYESCLEKELSLTKNDLFLKNYELKLLYDCYISLYKNNNIDSKLMDKVNKTYIHTKYKGEGSFDNYLNYRFLFDHSKIFKILDRFITLDILTNLKKTNSFPDNNIYINTLDKTFVKSIKVEAYSITKKNEDIILLDIKKAFPSLDLYFLKIKLKNIFIKKFGLHIGNNILDRYLFLINNRRFYYNKICVNVLKGLPTGLSSSTLIFTLLFEDIFNELIQILNSKNIIINQDYELKIFVDDISLKIINKRKASVIYKYICNILEYYGYTINVNKSKISPNLKSQISIPLIKSGDFYLGIPFSDSIKNYLDICLKQFRKRHIDISYKDIKKIIILEGIDYHSELMKKINGFFQYKLYGLKKYGLDVSTNDLLNLINKYY